MSTPNSALNDELEAVNSIYDSNTLVVTHVEPSTSATHATLTLPDHPFSLSLSFPSKYPDIPPDVAGIQSTGASTKKGEGGLAVDVLRDVLGRIFVPGQVCLFDLIEETVPLLQSLREEPETQHRSPHGSSEDLTGNQQSRSAQSSPPPEDWNSENLTSQNVPVGATSTSPPNWILSDSLVVNRSTFVARALRVSDLNQATNAISHLLSTNKKVASATHNITAWRIKQAQTSPNASVGAVSSQDQNMPEVVIQDCDDDGETAAGGRLLHLMQLMDVWNVVVVVTRWYGGVKLGPDRFRLINQVAREALVNGGFVKEDSGKSKGKGKKK